MGKKTEVVWAKSTEFESWEERELKRRREKETEAATRVALEKVERSVVGLFDDNLHAEIEISVMCRSSPCYLVCGRNPLNGLGLFLKRDDGYDDDDDHHEEVVMEVHHTTNNNNNNNNNINNKSFKSHDGRQIDHTSSSSSSERPLSPRKAEADRVSMLKSRFMYAISNSQQQLGLLDFNQQNRPLMTKKDATFNSSSTRHYCKSKPRMNAPVPGAILA